MRPATGAMFIGMMSACGGASSDIKHVPATTGPSATATTSTTSTNSTIPTTTTTTTSGMLTISEYADQTDPNGFVEVLLDVPAGTTSFQVTVDSGEDWVFLESLSHPDGTQILHWTDLYYGARSLTGSVFGDTKVNAFNWPVRLQDGPLVAGVYRLTYGVNNNQGYYIGGADLNITTVLKVDPDLANAEVGVQISYADGVDDDPAVVAAVEEAVERWRTVWGAQGLTLHEHYESTTLDPTLQWTYTGDPSVKAVAELKNEGDLHVVIGDQIRSEMFTYGVSAGIPGTIMATTSTYVNISWLVHAGPNGTWDPGEATLMGETMAHEVGHYVGLFHPVEWGFYNWDAIADTPDCSSAPECESVLGTNLMYAYSICDQSGCLPTEDITPGQAEVMQLSVGAL